MARTALVVAFAAAALAACAEAPPPPAASEAPTGIRFLSAGADDGFERAIEPIELDFPRDHGAHPEYRTEWWYFTGNLLGGGGRHLGFEVTFFRFALAAARVPSASAWAANQAWMAHFAITDTEGARFIAHERFARGALGLAGAEGTPLRVWVEDWEAVFGGASGEEIRLRASSDGTEIDVALTALKAPVVHGDGALDAKGPEPGNASYYYSVPRLRATGSIALEGERLAVEGLAWMDREWGTSTLSAGIAGWDWFALQLDDGSELMWYRLRETGGGTSPFSGGSRIAAGGARRALGPDDAALEPVRLWRSPATGVVYPVAWRLAIARDELELAIEPVLDSQEVALSVRYWEGAVRVTGTAAGRPVRGNGYLELAGY